MDLRTIPQKRETIRYFRGDVALPERIILLDGSGSISFDVLSWLAEQKVSLIRIDWKGDIVCVAGASGYSANPFRVRWQLETRENPAQRNDFCRSIITRKIEARIITLEKSIPRSDKWERAMKSAYAALSRLEENPPENISELRALEANCAASYFRSWVGMPIKWRGTSRRPIPDNWHSIGARSSPYHLAGNRNAAHPVNAILNYAYAALESEIRIKAISEGYDPTIGIMHEGSDGSSKFIFDLMEPERPRLIVPCWISSRDMFSIRPTLSFAPTAYAGSIRKWRAWWWRRFLHRKSTTRPAGVDVARTLPAMAGRHRNWADSVLTVAASETTGVRAKAVVPL